MSSDTSIWVSRRNLVQDLSRRYVVFIDGSPAGEVAPYRTVRFEVSPGWHRVWARLPGTGDAVMGDVVLNVWPGEVRRVRTITRLKRLTFWELVKVLGETLLQFMGREGLRLPVEFAPRVLLRAWPPSEHDADPPSAVGLPLTAAAKPSGVSPRGCALADRVRTASFAQESHGYSPRDVDRHLDAVATALDRGVAVDPAEITASGYTRVRRGYEVAGVDRFLDELRARLMSGSATGEPEGA